MSINPISKIFAVILATFVMFYFVTYQNYKKLEDLAYIHTYETVTNFVDNVRMKGFITPEMYKDFTLELHTGSEVLYDISMEHQQKKYVPVYSDPTNIASFTGKYEVNYESFVEKQITDILYNSTIPYERRIYKLQNGDFFNVTVTNKTKFKSTMLLNMMTGGISGNDEVIYFPYGGMVLNQDWTDR